MPALAILAALLPPVAQAARPMVTDDARLTDAGACQLETWWHAAHAEKTWWALPACNPGGNLEFTAGGALARADGRMQSGGITLQGKTLFKTLETNGYGIGLAVGYAVQPGNAHSGSPYFYVPTSFSFADDRWVIHTNLGALREPEEGRTRLSWGIGSEIQTTDRLYLMAETYGQDVGRPFLQLGIRYWLVPAHVQLDTTYGNRLGFSSDERWISIGLRLISSRLF